MAKRTFYDEDLSHQIERATERAKSEEENRLKKLHAPIPLPTDEEMDLIIRAIHRAVAQQGGERTEFKLFNFRQNGAPDLFPYGWKEISAWKLHCCFENIQNVPCKTDTETFEKHAHIRDQLRNCFDHVCKHYNETHTASSAKPTAMGFEVSCDNEK